MGLDMYLFKRKKNEPNGEPEEVTYWRKANQIRNWIVNHTDYKESADCEEFKLTKYNLAFENGLIVERAGRNNDVVKLMPCLLADDETLRNGLEIFVNAAKKVIDTL